MQRETKFAATMTPKRFKECLASLRWTQRGLAACLDCDDRVIRRWASESDPASVPPDVAVWLEALAQVHEAIPPPQGWKKRQIPSITSETPPVPLPPRVCVVLCGWTGCCP